MFFLVSELSEAVSDTHGGDDYSSAGVGEAFQATSSRKSKEKYDWLLMIEEVKNHESG
jgi:hypothetical protein